MGSIRRFQLHRDLDVSGVSGVGIVADGVQFVNEEILTWADGARTVLPAGWCRVTWRGEHHSTVLWPSIEDVIAVNGHGGATRIVWVDGVSVDEVVFDSGGDLPSGRSTVFNDTGRPEPVVLLSDFLP